MIALDARVSQKVELKGSQESVEMRKVASPGSRGSRRGALKIQVRLCFAREDTLSINFRHREGTPYWCSLVTTLGLLCSNLGSNGVQYHGW